MSLIDRIVQLHPLFFSIDEYLKKSKPIHLCRLFEKLGLPVPRYLVGAPGYGPDLLVGGTPSADSIATPEATYHPSKACDNNEGTYWSSGDGPAPYPHWWKYDFGSVKVVTKLRMKARESRLKNFTLQGSPNDSAWYDVYSGQQANNELWQDYTFANTTAYRYYRIYSAGPDWYGDNWMQIFEVEMMESEPVAPSGCASSYVATNNAKCTWSDNSQNETNFRIEKDIDGAGFSFWKNVAANVEDSGTYTLGANHQIRFRVRAYNGVGYSTWSTSGYTYTTPSPPTGATTAYVATNNAKLTWNDNSAYEQGFKLQYAKGAGGWTDWKTVGPNVEDSGNYSAGANTRIKFRVCAYKGTLYSTYSEGSYVYTIPTAPSGIALSWLSQDETIRIQWTDNSAYEQDFDIEKKSDEGAFSHLVYDPASPYDDAAPSGTDHRYAYQVRARCPDGRLSSWNTSGWIYSTPNAPTNCAISLGTINVTWTDNSAYEDGFKIERELDGGGWNLVHTTGAEAESWADASQPTDANVKYQYRVRAYVGGLYSTYSTSNILNVQLLTESLALKEEETAHVSCLLTESLAMLESLPTLARALTLTESLALLESLPTLERGLTLEEFLALKEEETAHVSCLLTESLAMKEDLTQLGRALTLEESLALKEKLTGFGFTLEESLAMKEDLTQLGRALTLEESLALKESETAHVHSVLTESLAMKEDLTQLGRALTLEESLALLEEAHAETLLFEVDKDGNITYMGTLHGGAF